MSRLLYANLARMIRSRVFWIAEIFLAGYSIFIYMMGRINVRNNIMMTGRGWTLYFFNEMLFIHVVMAVFIPFFIGVEYSDGTIRNKITVGHTRENIYLANVLVCYAAGILQFLTYSVVSGLSALFLIGPDSLTSMEQTLWRIGYSLLIALAYTAVFSMIAMLDNNKARAVVTELALAFVSVMLMTQIYADLQEPELTSRVVMEETGEMALEENIPNSKYLSGTKRTVYEWIDAFLPEDQAMYVIDPEAAFSIKAPLCLLGESAVLIAAGVYLFRRKDIK
ncbi:MAG: ABC transporter permease [Blautia sp.]|nr:ABC transporter permease [Blautia sp.]MCM1199659.1 ABC transporter permease [Bacteroides fragilis]